MNDNQLKMSDGPSVADIMLEQLEASRVNGFPFFAYSGIREYVKMGDDELLLHLPKNPSNFNKVEIRYDYALDSYNVSFYKQSVPLMNVNDIYADVMAEVIAREMGIL